MLEQKAQLRAAKPHNHFDLLRHFLALAVIVSHSFPLALGREASPAHEWLSRLSHGQLDVGMVAVDCFFMISGFLVLMSWLRAPRLREFARKRALRIVPAYWACALICTLVFVPTVGRLDVPTLVSSLLFLSPINVPGAVPHNPLPGFINGSTWSIQYEVWVYALVPLFGWLGAYGRRRWLVPAALAAAFALYCLQQSPWAPQAMSVYNFGFTSTIPVAVPFRGEWPRLLCFFLAGMAFQLFRDRIRLDGRVALGALALLAGLAISGRGLALALPFAGTYLLFFLALHPGGRALHLGGADLSYGLYLYAFPIQQTLIAAFPGIQPAFVTLAAIPLTVVCAAASWYCVEAPFLKLKTRRQMPEELKTTWPTAGCGKDEPGVLQSP